MHHTAEARSTALGTFLCVMPPGDETAVVSRDNINHLKLPDGHLPLFIQLAPEIDAVASAVQGVFPARDIILRGKRFSNGSGRRFGVIRTVRNLKINLGIVGVIPD